MTPHFKNCSDVSDLLQRYHCQIMSVDVRDSSRMLRLIHDLKPRKLESQHKLFVWRGSSLSVWSVYHALKIPRLPQALSFHLFIWCLQMLAVVDVHTERSSLEMQKALCCAGEAAAVKHAPCAVSRSVLIMCVCESHIYMLLCLCHELKWCRRHHVLTESLYNVFPF